MRTMPPSVLVVDDDPEIRRTLAFLLTEEGYRVLAAQNGATALHLLKAHPGPFVVILDYLMPQMTGLDLLLLVERDPRLAGRDRYILVSATSPGHVHELAEALARLGVPHIAKPFNVDTLLAAVHDATLCA